MDKSQDFTKAKELGKKELAELPKIIKLSLDKQNRRLVFDLTNSVTLIVPADLL